MGSLPATSMPMGCWRRPVCPARPIRRSCARRRGWRRRPSTPTTTMGTCPTWRRVGNHPRLSRRGPAAQARRRLGPRPAAIGEEIPGLVAAGRAAGRPRQSGGGGHSPARAEFWAPRERAAEAATALREEVHGLVDRLQAALGIEDEEPRPWREALLALAHQTPRGLWTVEARLLYDLQKVCADRGRTISTVDVMHWILSLGRRPIRRDLPNQREVLVSRHLRSAQRRLSRGGFPIGSGGNWPTCWAE